jgi:RNA polymerase primary sigma factor
MKTNMHPEVTQPTEMKLAYIDGRSNILFLYLREMGAPKLLTREQERDLAAESAQGKPGAWDSLIRASLRIVVDIARDYAGKGLPLTDLISEGNIALMEAAGRFDHTRGNRLYTYARRPVTNAIRLALSNKSRTIRIPTHALDKVNRIHKVERRYEMELGCEPTDVELANEARISPRSLPEYRSLQQPVSLDALIDENGHDQFGNMVPDPHIKLPSDEAGSDSTIDRVFHHIDRLPEHERAVLTYRFGLGGEKEKTTREVGTIIRRSHKTVQNIQCKTLKKLRAKLLKEGITTSLDC